MRTFKDTHIYIWNPLDDVYQIVVGRVVIESDFIDKHGFTSLAHALLFYAMRFAADFRYLLTVSSTSSASDFAVANCCDSFALS